MEGQTVQWPKENSIIEKKQLLNTQDFEVINMINIACFVMMSCLREFIS
jgi:hypothetical protein